MRGEGAQRAELPADQRQLGLQQALLVVQRIRALFQFAGQLFFGIALNRHRTFFGQAPGDFVEAGGQALGAGRQRTVRVAEDNFAAVRAKPREITQEGVRQHQKAQADVRLLTEMPGLHQHVAEGGGQCGFGVVRIAPGQAVGQVVAFAADVLLDDLPQVGAVAAEGVGQHAVEPAALPVRQDQEHREAGDQAADQGVDQAWQDQAVAVADLVEAEQHQQGDRRGGQGVAAAAGGEEGHPGGYGEEGLHQRAGEQVEQRPAEQQAEHGAGDPLHQLEAGGAVVRLADEHRGQQDPVALGRVNPVQHAIAGGQGDGQAQGVAEQQRGRGQLLAQAFPDLLQRVWLAIQQAAVLLLGQGIGVAGVAEQLVEGGEVAGQGAERAQQLAPGRVALQVQVLQ
ncbi:hypothetical protein D3C85_677750 [compost metagenome]